MNSHETQPSILDCGCGFGSESIAFGLLGAKVIGVDLCTEWLNAASKRLEYIQDRYSCDLDVSFRKMNILDYECDQPFDMIHAKEFVSHIYSIPKFIKLANKSLRRNGHLVITDANPLNAIECYKAWRAHKDKLYTVVRDPRTGKEVPYALERLVSPLYLKSILLQYDFKSVLHFYGFPLAPSRLISPIRFIESRTALPFLGLYEVVATKNSAT
jgi:2-polyprenyl-3-methyl-5-hydroxy-6-metoxy-1,4-benzoquinol methylase